MNTVTKYTKKPVTIEAIQFANNAETIQRIHEFMGSKETVVSYADKDNPVIKIETQEGVMTASVGDWIIKGVKSEFYPCKPVVFKETYSPAVPHDNDTDKMSFGQAIEAIKAGKRVARKGWNGKGMFLWLLPAGEVPKNAIHDPAIRTVIDEHVEGDTFAALPSICMWTRNAEGRWGLLTGWLASQTDMLSDDWEILE